MPNRYILAIGFVCLFSPPIFSADALDVVARGFAEYAAHGPEAAWNAWTDNSSLQTNEYRKTEYERGSVAAASEFGKLKGYELIRQVPISKSVTIVYCACLYDRGVLYMKFNCYQTGKSWIITWIQCSDILEEIVPLRSEPSVTGPDARR